MEQQRPEPQITPEEVAESKAKAIERLQAEKLKLDQYGRIGQKVRVVGVSSRGEGEIVGVEVNKPFNDETFSFIQSDESTSLMDIPTSTTKVMITEEGPLKGHVVSTLISEWEPIEVE